MENLPPSLPPVPPILAYQVAAGILKRSRRELKAAEVDLAKRVRDAVALSFKRKGNGVEPYDETTLASIGRLAIKVDLLKAKVANARRDEQTALLNTPANG